MDIELPPDFKECLRLLHEKAAEYLLVGGYAVGYYGYPRPTGDMDIWIASNPENATKLVAALEEFGFASSIELFLEENNIVRMGVPPSGRKRIERPTAKQTLASNAGQAIFYDGTCG